MKNEFLSWLSRTPKEIKGDRAIKENCAAHALLDEYGISAYETYLTDGDCKMKYFSLAERISMLNKK